jgi:sarcosine oxidase
VPRVRVVVVGLGAWGLPTAAELRRRGHDVLMIDRHGPASGLGSSSGPSRLWRLSHPDRARVRLARRAVDAWRRLEARSGEELLLRRGLLWRDAGSNGDLADALTAEGVPFTAVDAGDVGRFLPGLRPSAVGAVWQEDAGPVRADRALAVQLGAVQAAGGVWLAGHRVVDVRARADGVEVVADDGWVEPADVVVLAPGPGAVELLPRIGVELELHPVLEQVTYLDGRPGWEELACWYEGEHDGRPGLYAMPTPGSGRYAGYKIGIDRALRDLSPDDLDRTPDADVEAAIVQRVADDLAEPGGMVTPVPRGSQVCSWTDSPDGRFVLDRVLDGRVVIACGDSGEGFKFSALMGEVLADLAEGATPDPDIASFGLARFAAGAGARPALGR